MLNSEYLFKPKKPDIWHKHKQKRKQKKLKISLT